MSRFDVKKWSHYRTPPSFVPNDSSGLCPEHSLSKKGRYFIENKFMTKIKIKCFSISIFIPNSAVRLKYESIEELIFNRYRMMYTALLPPFLDGVIYCVV